MPNQTLEGPRRRHTDGPDPTRYADTHVCDEMTKEADAGRNKAAAARRGPPHGDVEGSHPESVESQPSGQYVPSTFDSVDPRRRGTSWPLLACGLRAPCTAICFLGATGHASAIFPRLLPRSCRQMSCTWMIHLPHRMLCVAGSARLDRLSQRWHHCHNDRQVSV